MPKAKTYTTPEHIFDLFMTPYSIREIATMLNLSEIATGRLLRNKIREMQYKAPPDYKELAKALVSKIDTLSGVIHVNDFYTTFECYGIDITTYL